jgi:hypothetical protein
MLASFLVALPCLVLCIAWTLYHLVAWLLAPRKQAARSPYPRGARVHAPVEITRIRRGF